MKDSAPPSRHDWLNAWLVHDDCLESLTDFIFDCFETCPDIPEAERWKRAEAEALSIIDDLYCGNFQKLKQYPKHLVPEPPESNGDSFSEANK